MSPDLVQLGWLVVAAVIAAAVLFGVSFMGRQEHGLLLQAIDAAAVIAVLIAIVLAILLALGLDIL